MKSAVATADQPTCATHPDVNLIPTKSGWVCPRGCGEQQVGRRYRDLPEEFT